MSTIKVRRLARDELDRVTVSLDSRPPEEHRRRLEATERGGFVYLFAWIGDEAVGFVGVGLQAGWSAENLMEARGYARVRDLFVGERYRRRGVARALMTALEREARDAGMPGMILDTGTSEYFAAARELYRSLGYLDRGGVYLGGWSNPDRPGEHFVDPLTLWMKPF